MSKVAFIVGFSRPSVGLSVRLSVIQSVCFSVCVCECVCVRACVDVCVYEPATVGPQESRRRRRAIHSLALLCQRRRSIKRARRKRRTKSVVPPRLCVSVCACVCVCAREGREWPKSRCGGGSAEPGANAVCIRGRFLKLSSTSFTILFS